MNRAEQISVRNARAAEMASDYRLGSTLAEIGSRHGITRERARQLIRLAGVTRFDGGKCIKAFAQAKRINREDKFLPAYGCTRREVVEINSGKLMGDKTSASRRYYDQKRNARYRGIDWEFTFPQWMRIWEESGKWEQRGRGQGYCMTRIGDTGPYSAENVEIKTIGENFSESYYKHPHRQRFPNLRVIKNRTHCIHGHDYSVVGKYPNGCCKLCSDDAGRAYRLRKKAQHELRSAA